MRVTDPRRSASFQSFRRFEDLPGTTNDHGFCEFSLCASIDQLTIRFAPARYESFGSIEVFLDGGVLLNEQAADSEIDCDFTSRRRTMRWSRTAYPPRSFVCWFFHIHFRFRAALTGGRSALRWAS